MEPVTPVGQRRMWPYPIPLRLGGVQASSWPILLIIASALPLIYALGLALPYPLPWGLTHPGSTWVRPGQGSLPTLAGQIGVYLLLTLGYVAALRLLRAASPQPQPRRQLGLIWLNWALCSGVLLLAAPNGESHDIYDYVFRGRMLARFAASPLAITPNAYPDASFYTYVSWKRHVDTYGPLWEYASGTTARTVRVVLAWTGTPLEPRPSCPRSAASCRVLAAYITGYRLLAILLTGLSGLLIFALVRATQPPLAPYALATWLWNPLLLVSTALGAHNDALMLCLLFLTYWLWQRKHWLAGWLALGLAAHVKLTILLFVPVLGLWQVRQIGWLRAIGSSLMAVGLTLGGSWLLYEPLGGWETLPRMLYERQLFVANSLAQILYFLLYKWSAWPYELVWQMMVPGLTWYFLGAAALLLWRFFQRLRTSSRPTPDELYRACVLLALLYLLVGSFWFQPWYLLWVLAPAALWVEGRWPCQGLPWACFGALVSNIVFDHLTQLPIAAEPEAHLYRVGVTVLLVLTIWLPLFLRQISLTRGQKPPQTVID